MKKHFLLTILIALAIFLLAACAAQDAEMFAPSAPAPGSAPPPPMVVLSFDVAEEAAEADFAPAEPTAVAQLQIAESAPLMRYSADQVAFGITEPTEYLRLPMLTPATAGDRRLIYDVSMRLQTTEFMPGIRLLLDAIGEAGGYVVNYEIRGSDIRQAPTERAADFRFRLPTEQLPDFIIIIENNYNILNLRQDMREVTATYRQNVWSLEELRSQESNLLEALETARGNRYIELSDQLRAVRVAIRDLETAQAAIMTDVVYSTIDIQLFEAFLPEEGEEEDQSLPVASIVIAVLALAVVILIILLAKKKSRAKAPKNTDTGTTTPADSSI